MNGSQRFKLAMERFFAANPRLAADADNISEAAADAVGSTWEEAKYLRRRRVFEVAAKARGIDAFEYAIQLVAESPAQAHAWRLEQWRKTADAIGMDWEEFKALNRIEE